MRLFVLLLIGCLSLGCSQKSGTAPASQKEAGDGINQLRDLLVEAAGSSQAFKKKSDVSPFEGRYPAAVNGVNDGSLTIVWGKSIREGLTGPGAIIAYQTSAATDGGWVVRESSEIQKVSADDFKKEAPK